MIMQKTPIKQRGHVPEETRCVFGCNNLQYLRPNILFNVDRISLISLLRSYSLLEEYPRACASFTYKWDRMFPAQLVAWSFVCSPRAVATKKRSSLQVRRVGSKRTFLRTRCTTTSVPIRPAGLIALSHLLKNLFAKLCLIAIT